MSKQTWKLIDSVSNSAESRVCLTQGDLPSAKGNWKVTKRRLQGGMREGVDVVEIDNGRMQLVVVPTRGMGIWRACLNDEQTLGWRSPVRGPVHPSFVPVSEPSGLGWLDGFDELVVRCGLESNGEPEFDEQGRLIYPLHGRIANRTAYDVEVTVDDAAGTIALRGIVEETRFNFQKLRLAATITTGFDTTAFAIHDEVENYGGTPAEMQMLYHMNFGEPLLEPGSQIVAPVRSIEPRNEIAAGGLKSWNVCEHPNANAAEQCFYLDLLADAHDRTQVMIKNAQGTAGAAVEFNNKHLPCFTIWKNMVARADGYVVGLEPGTNFPNKRSFESQHGRVIQLPAGGTWSADIKVDWLTNAQELGQVENAIKRLEG